MTQRHEKARVDGKKEHEIHFARMNHFRKLRAINQKESLEELLDKVARANQHYHLPFRPSSDGIGMQVNHTIEPQLQGKPEQFHE